MKRIQPIALLAPLVFIILSAFPSCNFIDLYRLPDGNTIEQELEEEAEEIIEDEIERNYQKK